MIIRKASREDPAAVGKLYTESWKATYDGLIADEYLNALQYKDAEVKWSDFLAEPENVMFVAEEDGYIKGFAAGCSCVIPESGELYALYVDHAAKGNGTGSRLLSAVAEHFRERGKKALIVWVMSTNENAVSFYKRRGAVTLAGRKHRFADETVDDVCLVWRDISLL